jgi:monoamine oxidase
MSRTSLFDSLRRSLQLARTARATGIPIDEVIERAAEARRIRQSRRDFLRVAAGGAAMLAAVPILSACGDDDDGNGADGGPDGGGGDGGGGDARVAVIGGGLAGLHCAYRLQQAGVDVKVFEASSRTGGRTFTARGMLPDKQQIAELGGEFIDSGHATMLALADEFKFQLDDLIEGKGVIVGDTYYFDGDFRSEKEVIAEFEPLAPTMAAALTLGEKDDAEFERLDAISIAEWLADKKEGNAGPLITALLNVAYTGEYGLDADEQSIWNLLYLIDFDTPDPFRIFGDSDEQFHLHLGSDSIATALADGLEGRIEVDTILTAVARDGSRYRLSFDRDSGSRDETFDHVVLALPFSTLRDVDLTEANIPEDKLQVISEVGYGTNAKLIGSFTSRVWNDMKLSGSSYSDLGYLNTWDTSRGQDGASGVLTNYLGGVAGLNSDKGTPDERMVDALDNQGIDTVYPGVSAAYAKGSALRFHWPTAPFNKGSYTCYRPGQWAFYGLEGERADNIHFCGEHCSLDYQGYMEGAAETGALAAMEVLDDLGIAAGPPLRRVLAARLARPSPAGLHGRRLFAHRRRLRGRPAPRRRAAR